METVVVTENGKEVSRKVGGVERLTDGSGMSHNVKRIKTK